MVIGPASQLAECRAKARSWILLLILIASLLISRATTEKSAFYFSDSPFWFSGTMPSYCMTVLWRRRSSKVHSSLIFVLFVLHSVFFHSLGIEYRGPKNNNQCRQQPAADHTRYRPTNRLDPKNNRSVRSVPLPTTLGTCRLYLLDN